jgi:prolyl 4-hydroxylase
MQTTCAPACFSCRSIDFDYRCPLDKSGYTALAQPGDLHAMFERILTVPQFEVYQPVALSRPSNATANDAPYILQLDNVLSAEECETMIQLGADRGYKNSTEVGGTTRFDGKRDSTLSERRTSQTTWCKNECGAHHVTQAVTQRLEALTGIGEQHYEYFQLLKYDVGQHYVSHNDYLPHQVNRRQGVRVRKKMGGRRASKVCYKWLTTTHNNTLRQMLTAYMYLNEVDAGGGTRFTSLNLTVTPKPGRLILWPSVLDADTSAEEGRTNHEALPVEKGIKYGKYKQLARVRVLESISNTVASFMLCKGTNAWIHQRDYKTPHEEGCA